MTQRRAVLKTLAATALAAPMLNLRAQGQWPNKTITLVVSYPAGGDTDNLARAFAEKLTTRLGQPVVVDNRPGAAGIIGNTTVARAAPDGYTLLLTPNTISIATLVNKMGGNPPYNAVNDFAPIIEVGNQPLFLAVNTAAGVTNVKELVAAIKGGKIKSYASPGVGSPMHILGELFDRAAGIKTTHVAYRGSAPAIVDVVGGHIPMTYTTLGPVQQHIQAGKIAMLGVASARRSTLTPNVPTLAEAGVSGVEVGAWQGIMGPKGLPPEIIRVLNGHMNEILKMPDIVARMTLMGAIPTGGEPAALGKRHADDHVRYGKVIEDAGIKSE
jgi:tripartite-type tricarboxylate transporter receptor subunit TctC